MIYRKTQNISNSIKQIIIIFLMDYLTAYSDGFKGGKGAETPIGPRIELFFRIINHLDIRYYQVPILYNILNCSLH